MTEALIVGRSAPSDPLELLDRALAYTCGALATVSDAALDLPSPCAGWSLRALLTHMDDALDAFAEGSGGHIALTAAAPAAVRVARLQTKAGALHGHWGQAQPPHVSVGDVAVETDVLVLAAALEITVHGWDVATATGHHHPIPDALAALLLPVAALLVDPDDRGTRFGAALPVAHGATASVQLLAHLGRLG